MIQNNGTFIIAEAGVNHNGDLDLALRLVAAAADAGADAVKFQTFRAEEGVTANAPKAKYQKKLMNEGESQLEMLKRLQLSQDDHFPLMDLCVERGIEFMSTPFDMDSIDFLAGKMDLKRLKMGSGEIVNGPLLLAAAQTGKDIILSTGNSTLDEVREALGVLAFGFMGLDKDPSETAFREAYDDKSTPELLRQKVTLLHCTTEYPAPFEDVNLRGMDTLRAEFGLAVGLSDHSPGIAVGIAAAALGACIIEKHFTLDHALPGPDHKASILPEEMTALVNFIRQVEPALGSGAKEPAPSEKKNLEIVRKSLVARRVIAKGEIFTTENLGVKRPGNGISPMRYWEYLGRPAKGDYQKDEPVK